MADPARRASDWTAAVLSVAQSVADHLGDEWTATVDRYDRDGFAAISRPDGATLVLEVEDPGMGRFRLAIRGEYPRSSDGRHFFGPHSSRCRWLPGPVAAHITVDGTRDRASIARSIERRFLPRYLAEWTEASSAARAYEASLRTAEATAKRIGRACGVTPVQWSRDQTWAIHTEEGRILVRESHADAPHIEVQLHGISAAKAEKIARALAPKGRHE